MVELGCKHVLWRLRCHALTALTPPRNVGAVAAIAVQCYDIVTPQNVRDILNVRQAGCVYVCAVHGGNARQGDAALPSSASPCQLTMHAECGNAVPEGFHQRCVGIGSHGAVVVL